MSPQQSVLELAPDIVDLTLWKLLGAIDDGLLALYFAADGEAPVALEDAGNGEMLGRYVDDAEWLARYAAERYYPYISNTFALEMPSDERDDGRRN